MFHGQCFTRASIAAVPVVRFPGSNEPKSGPLADPSLDPNARLKVVLRELQRSREEWERTCAALDGLEEIDDVDHKTLATARAMVRSSYDRWATIAAQADTLATDMRRAAPLRTEYEQLYEEKLSELKEQFDGGPHYDLLCERVAGLHTRLKMMERSTHEFPLIEHARLNQQLLSYINQLQKYTEAMKSEQISAEAQGVAEKLLMIVEKSLATSYPELWHTVMRDVRVALESAA